MPAGDVRAVRQMRGSVQAEVLVGLSASKGNVWLKIEGRGKAVREAMDNLQRALAAEAFQAVREAQEDTARRQGGTP